MTSRPELSSRSASQLSASGLSSAGSSVRPRNRRFVSDNNSDASTTTATLTTKNDRLAPPPISSSTNGLLSTYGSSAASRTPRPADNSSIGQFLEDSVSQSWLSVQGIASSFFGTASSSKPGRRSAPGSRYSSRSPNGRLRDHQQTQQTQQQHQHHGRKRAGSGLKNEISAWGPEPPSKALGIDDVAAGSLAEREAALKAARTASVLESHDGVNGGLDITGRHKRRNSDDYSASQAVEEEEDCLVYGHRVQSSDTYVGIILRYKCREDAFRKANGLWSRDAIQTKKWLTIPVDACEIRGRPCDPPNWANQGRVDLLATTPDDRTATKSHDDFFGRTPQKQPDDAQDKPWEHVRWVKIDSMPEPIEIGRISRHSMGYFPPRRKKSFGTLMSTPRQSSDFSVAPPPGVSDRPGSRRQSSVGSTSNRPSLATSPLSARSRVNSEAAEHMPAFMRRPGGVGTMGRSVRAPGPDTNNFYAWAAKHFPSLNFEDLPTMSVMGAETLKIGFSMDAEAAAGVAEDSFERGRDASSRFTSGNNGNGLDRAAAAVEAWLRGALAKRPGTPMLGARRVGSGGFGGLDGDNDSDLIELADAASDDGRTIFDTGGLMDSLDHGEIGSSARGQEGTVKARIGKKKDD